MTAQRGKDLLLKLGDGAEPETFTSVAGLRTKTLSLNAAAVDVTHAQSEGGWRELLGNAGLKQASVAGAGIFLSGAVAEAVRQIFFNGDVRRWRIVIPGLGAVEGPFLISNLDYAGDHASEAQASLALDSAGALVFTGEGA
jgi:TP901-1 family phage major tail protein